MFSKKGGQSENQQSGFIVSADPTMPKYLCPKILLIDMKDDTETLLKGEGYNVVAGNFGVPYRVPKEDKLFPVIINGSLPSNFTEREIIIIDLVPHNPLSQPKGEKHTSPGENDWWASCSEGVIDPRPRLMEGVKEYFDRIFEHGGVFIIFADSRNRPRVIWGHQSCSGRIEKERDIYCDNWGFLSILDSLVVEPDHGEEMSVVQKESSLGQVLSEHAQGGAFCALYVRQNG